MGYVLLTAAVTPDARYGSAVSDAQVRLAQYQFALVRWASVAEQKGWSIVLVETTGYPASELLASVGEAREFTEVVHFTPDASLAERGKGAVEASAIDHAFTTLGISDAAPVYKATGRLTVGNADRLLVGIDEGAATVRRTLDGKYCDTRFFGTTAGFWRGCLAGMADEVDDQRGRYLEHVMANRLREAEYAHAAKIGRFRERPHLVGVSGTTGSTYGRFNTSLKDMVLGPLERIMVSQFMKKQV